MIIYVYIIVCIINESIVGYIDETSLLIVGGDPPLSYISAFVEVLYKYIIIIIINLHIYIYTCKW